MRTKGPRADKVADVERMRELFRNCAGAILTDYRGLTVAEISALRRKLRAAGGEYHVVKNTLFRRAVGEQLTPELEELLVGPTAIAFASGDVVGVARDLVAYLRDLRKPEVAIKGGYVDGRVLSAEDVSAISKLPAKDVILAQALGTLQAPLSNFVGTLHGVLSEFARTLQALADQQQAQAA